jgi:V8-like Glu-specific endopeptidase
MRGGRGAGRHVRQPTARRAWAVTAVVAAALAAVVVAATAHAAARLAGQLAAAASTVSRYAPRAPQAVTQARLFSGRPAVGALFTDVSGHLGKHFCTAAVVASPAGDLVLTAAHCVSGHNPAQIAFVPGFHDGKAPFGIWVASKVFVDAQWQQASNPDHDVAFLLVHQPGTTATIEHVTGGERLGIGWAPRFAVHVIGYPAQGRRPIICAGRTGPFTPQEMEFACGGFTEGTSGGPFLAGMNPVTGQGVVIGVIGGFEQGGELAWVSYSPRFGRALQALYRTATISSPGR